MMTQPVSATLHGCPVDIRREVLLSPAVGVVSKSSGNTSRVLSAMPKVSCV